MKIKFFLIFLLSFHLLLINSLFSMQHNEYYVAQHVLNYYFYKNPDYQIQDYLRKISKLTIHSLFLFFSDKLDILSHKMAIIQSKESFNSNMIERKRYALFLRLLQKELTEDFDPNEFQELDNSQKSSISTQNQSDEDDSGNESEENYGDL